MHDDHTFSRRAVIAGFAAIPRLSADTAAANAHNVAACARSEVKRG